MKKLPYWIGIIVLFIILELTIISEINKAISNYIVVSLEEFIQLVKENEIKSVEVFPNYATGVSELKKIRGREVAPTYYKLIFSSHSKEREKLILELNKLKADFEVNVPFDIKNYLFLIPYLGVFFVILALITASRRGNLKALLFREDKFHPRSPLNIVRLLSINWHHIMSMEPETIKSTFLNLPVIEQENYLLLLLEALSSGELEVRRASAFALREIKDPRTFKPLAELLMKDKDPHIRMNAALTLGYLGEEKAVKVLINALADPHPLVRCAVVAALGEIGGEKDVLEALVTTLQKDESWRVRRSVLISLVKLRSEKIIPFIVKALEDKEQVVRASAAISLGEIGDEECIAPLAKALSCETSKEVKCAIIDAMVNIGSKEIIPVLMDVVNLEEEVAVRKRALLFLEVFIDEPQVKELFLKVASSDVDKELRLFALDALSYLEGKDIEEFLTNLSKEEKDIEIKSFLFFILEERAHPLIVREGGKYVRGDRDFDK